MADIVDYGTLKAELSNVLFHTRFVGRYDVATRNFERAANRRLRVRQMETSTLLTTVGGAVAVPSDYLLWRTVLWTGGRDPELQYVHPAFLDRTELSGNPPIFTIEGSTFKTRPMHDDPDAYEFHYYQKIPTIIGADTATNWLLDANADVYLFGVLTELFALGRNLEAAQLHKARRDELFAEIIQLSALTTGATSSQVRESSEYF